MIYKTNKLTKFYTRTASIFGIALLHNCASISPPQGGKKDVIAPKIVETKPRQGQTDVVKNTITYYFDERIDIKDLKNNLIINPKIEGEIETSADNNELVLKLPKGSLDKKVCKTFSVNLREGIKDANEGNVLKTDKLVFSNCSTIDTAKVEGFVVDAYSRDSLKNIFIGLYTYSDTLNIEAHKPDYYGFTNQKGAFFMNFIKPGIYKILAFDDKNKNLVYESKKEKLGFLTTNIHVTDSIFEKLELEVSQNDIKKPTIVSVKDDAEWTIKLDNPVKKYKIETDSTVRYKMADNNKEIIVYKNVIDTDSIPFKLYLQDSSKNDTTIFTKIIRRDTSKIKHQKNIIINKNKEEFTLNDSSKIVLKFTDPIEKINHEKIYLISDSSNTIKLTEKDLSWNNTKTLLTWKYDKSIKSLKKLIFVAEKRAFYSVKKDTNASFETMYKIVASKKEEENNFVSFIIDTKQKNFTIEILDEKGKVYYKTKNQKTFRLSNIPNGKYSLLAWIDQNEDGYWNVGHYKNNTQPEKSYLFKNIITVKTNWDIEDIHISF